MSAEGTLHPIAILVDELRSEDVALRLAAIHRISAIALALGQERTRDELIPFLHDSLDDDDEILLALAQELGPQFVEYVGGTEFAFLILAVLESLAAVEETLVREEATRAMRGVVELLDADQIQLHYLPLLRRLSSGDWFTSRTSATALFACAYPNADDQVKQEIRRMIATLCQDDTPMVRRAAAKELAQLVPLLTQAHLLADLLPPFTQLAHDDQDSVRLLTVPPLVQLATHLADTTPLDATLTHLLADKSWRVRYMLADNYVKLATAFHPTEQLLSAFTALLRDHEAEVRTAAAAQIPTFAALISTEQVLSKLLPCIRDLATDSSQHVRAALGTHISGLAPLLGKEITIEHLLPLFLQLLKDEFPDVRLNIISKLELVNSVIGIQLLSKALLPAIVELASDKQWRVRQAIIEYIPLLAQQLGVEFFDDSLGNLCMAWLGDPVFSIREAATINLRKLTEVFGVEWVGGSVLPKVLKMGSNENYLFRMTTIFAITVRPSPLLLR